MPHAKSSQEEIMRILSKESQSLKEEQNLHLTFKMQAVFTEINSDKLINCIKYI